MYGYFSHFESAKIRNYQAECKMGGLINEKTTETKNGLNCLVRCIY
ncbi:MAG: hypothetical protein JWP12_1103 [Bacteroidetes bacterium]|nr:hypothetical protein [Bacteroidota bacterium]